MLRAAAAAPTILAQALAVYPKPRAGAASVVGADCIRPQYCNSAGFKGRNSRNAAGSSSCPTILAQALAVYPKPRAGAASVVGADCIRPQYCNSAGFKGRNSRNAAGGCNPPLRSNSEPRECRPSDRSGESCLISSTVLCVRLERVLDLWLGLWQCAI